jgi:hypothetical protein
MKPPNAKSTGKKDFKKKKKKKQTKKSIESLLTQADDEKHSSDKASSVKSAGNGTRHLMRLTVDATNTLVILPGAILHLQAAFSRQKN